MILLIDNYDSFVHNLARYFNRLGQETAVVRNDAVSLAEIRTRQPAAIVLSPGPCTPREAGVSLEICRELIGTFPLLGVCLGHQTIAAALGGNVVRTPHPMHGRASPIRHNETGIFERLPNPLLVGRYHSLVVEEASLPAELEVTARSEEGAIMAISHRHEKAVGVQFHPESILTEQGYPLLANFLKLCELSFELPVSEERQLPPEATPLLMPSTPISY